MDDLWLLKSLITQNEWIWYIEFKENFDKEREWKNISAIANIALLKNRDFGYIIFWIKDQTKEIVGTNFDPKIYKVWNQNLHIWLSQNLAPKVYFEFIEIDKDNKRVIILKIEATKDRPIKFKGEAYIRIWESTTLLSSYPKIEEKIWNNFKNKNFEKQICLQNLKYDEVLKILDYDKYFNLTEQRLPTETKKFVERMWEDSLVKLQDDWNYSITVLWAILFSRNIEKIDILKRKNIRVIIYEGNSKGIRKGEFNWNKWYAIWLKGLVDFILQKIWKSEEIKKALRVEKPIFPEVALREFIANAIIHQDFSVRGAWPTIEVFSNRIEITNPWIPLIDLDRLIDYPPKSRNEDLASLMRRFWYCEESWSWVDRALEFIELYQLPAPKFEIYEESFTKVILYAPKMLRNMSEDDKIRACYQHCVLKHLSQEEKMTNSSLRERLKIPESNYPAASKIIKLALIDGKIKSWERSKEYVPYWA